MIVGVIAEELLLGLATIPGIVVDNDIVPSPTIKVPGFLLFESSFDEGDTIYQAYVGDVDNSVYPPLIVDPDTIFTFTRSASLAIVAQSFTDVDTIYRPIVLSKVLGPQLYIDLDIFGGVKKLTQGKATINQTFPIDTVIDIDIIFAPLVERSGVIVITQQAALATEFDTVYVNETTSSVTALLGSFVGETAGYTPPLGYLSPQPVGADDAIPVANVLGPVAPGILVDVDAFFTPTRGNYVTSNAVFDSDVFFAPFAARQLLPGVVVAADVINGPFFTQPGSFGLVIDAGEFIPVPIVTPQRATVGPQLLNDSAIDAFYAPIASPAIIAPSVMDIDTVLAPTVSFGALTPVVSVIDPDAFYSPVVGKPPITPALLVETDIFYAPAMGYDQTSSVGIVIDTDTFYAPSIAGIASFDGTLALDGPIMPSTPPVTVIYIEG
jgi:hypothetical protein